MQTSTHEQKDKILGYLIDNHDEFFPDDLEYEPINEIIPIRFGTLARILSSFEKQGLIKQLYTFPDDQGSGHFNFKMDQAAYDFFESGGFTNQWDVLNMTLQKLKHEVDQIKEESPEKYESWSTLIVNAISIISTLRGI